MKDDGLMIMRTGRTIITSTIHVIGCIFSSQNIDLSSLQLALTEKNSQLPDISCCGLPAVLADADPDVR